MGVEAGPAGPAAAKPMIYRVKQYSIKDDEIRELASLTHIQYSILLLGSFLDCVAIHT